MCKIKRCYRTLIYGTHDATHLQEFLQALRFCCSARLFLHPPEHKAYPLLVGLQVEDTQSSERYLRDSTGRLRTYSMPKSVNGRVNYECMIYVSSSASPPRWDCD